MLCSRQDCRGTALLCPYPWCMLLRKAINSICCCISNRNIIHYYLFSSSGIFDFCRTADNWRRQNYESNQSHVSEHCLIPFVFKVLLGIRLLVFSLRFRKFSGFEDSFQSFIVKLVFRHFLIRKIV